MPRKRITQIFPFLLPLRQKQRKISFYLGMRFDKNKYSKIVESKRLPYHLYTTDSLLLNKNSGFDMKYQFNKVHNLKLAAKTVSSIVIYPGETFSFWQLVRYADKHDPYKDGLILINGEIIGTYGGGLCQLSNMLFWMFLHTPLTILERHGHAVEAFPSTTEDLPQGTDATISEGWLDLKVKNNTDQQYQIEISFDELFMYGSIFTNSIATYSYEVFNRNNTYFKKGNKVFQKVSIYQKKTEIETNKTEDYWLYDHSCEIGYDLPENIEILTDY